MAFTTRCPDCREPLDVDDEYRTWKVRCPRCRHEFVPADADRRPARGRDRDDEPDRDRDPYPLAADDRDRDRYQDDEPRPRRRYRDDDEVVAHAMRAVAGPASWLRVIGVLGLLAGVAGCVGSVLLGMWVADNPAQAKRDMGVQNEEELIVNTIVLGVCSGFSLIFGALMTYGAIKMGRLESHGWGIAASVLAASSILYCTCCVVTGVPLGIWGLVVLSRQDVRDGFEIVAARRADRDPDPEPEPDRYDDDRDRD